MHFKRINIDKVIKLYSKMQWRKKFNFKWDGRVVLLYLRWPINPTYLIAIEILDVIRIA